MVTSKLRSWLKEAIIFVVILMLLLTVMDWWRGRSLPQNGLPLANYITIDGSPLNLSQLSQKSTVVMYFWASWCGPCKLTTPAVKKLNKHATVIAIAMQSGDDAAIHFEELHSEKSERHSWHNLNDNDRAIANDWKISVTPSVLFIKEGNVVGHTAGVTSYLGMRARLWWANR